MRLARQGYSGAAVAVCIPTLDGQSDRVARCVQAVLDFSPSSVEVVIADCEGELLGYTRPTTLAMSATHAEYLVAINDDVIVADGWLTPLLEQARADAWCVTPAEDQNGPVLLFAPHCMLWRADAWREIGGLDERFVHWASDIDLARRLFDAGHPPALVSLPNPVRHEVSATSHPELGPICAADLQRYEQKWGVSAEHDKHGLAALGRS